jgi:hypothetical protein
MNAEAPGPTGEHFEISFRDQRATVVEVGGGLRSYSAGGRELLDGFGADEPIASGRGQVLIPWPNRLEDGSYEFDGRTHQLPLTEPERGNAIHGLVRSELWRVVERESSRLVLGHVLDPQPGYPYSLELTIELRARGGRALRPDEGVERGADCLPVRRRPASVRHRRRAARRLRNPPRSRQNGARGRRAGPSGRQSPRRRD